MRRVLPGIGDSQCGFKFFDGEVARRAARDLRVRGFAFDVELLARCRGYGAVTTEIPIEWRDVPGSTFHPARHAWSCLRDVVRIRWMVGRIAKERPIRPADAPCLSCETLGAFLRPALGMVPAGRRPAAPPGPLPTGS